MNDIRSLSHSKWDANIILFLHLNITRQVIYKKLKADIGRILKLCERKGCEYCRAECCSNHIHMLVEIPPPFKCIWFMGYLKSKSSLMIFDRHANLKVSMKSTFWCEIFCMEASRQI